MENRNFHFVLALSFFPFLLYGRIFSRLAMVSHATGTMPTAAKMWTVSADILTFTVAKFVFHS